MYPKILPVVTLGNKISTTAVMLYYLGILLRHLYYCSIQRLHIRLSCVR